MKNLDKVKKINELHLARRHNNNDSPTLCSEKSRRASIVNNPSVISGLSREIA